MENIKQFTPTEKQVMVAIALLKRNDPTFGMKRITESLKITYPKWIIGKGRVQILLRKKTALDKLINDKDLDLKVLSEEPLVFEDEEENQLIESNEINAGENIEENQEGNNNDQEIDEFIKWGKKYNRACREYLDWVSRDYSLKVQTNEIPKEIFAGTDATTVILHDVRVPSRQGFRKDKVTKKKTPVTEDTIFNENEKIRKNVARGNTLLSVRYKNSNFVCFPLQANKKFTGGFFDDDDSDNLEVDVWKKFFIEDISNTTSIINTKKENGCAAHLAVIKLENKYFYIMGSKNVHIIAKDRKDLKYYKVEERLGVALIVANTVFDMLEKNEENKIKISEYLSSNHLTACFELLDPNDQHIENFAHMTKPMLKFITFTQASQVSETNQSNNSLCVNPLVSLTKAKEIGLDPIEFTEHPFSEFENICKEVRKRSGNEGAVLYFVNKSGNVIGLLKKKTIWYIFIRAIREKVKNYNKQINDHPETVVETCKKVNKDMGSKFKTRFKEIKEWLSLDEKTIHNWLDLANGMSQWICNSIINKKINYKEIATKFPVFWDSYLKDSKKSDKFDYN